MHVMPKFYLKPWDQRVWAKKRTGILGWNAMKREQDSWKLPFGKCGEIARIDYEGSWPFKMGHSKFCPFPSILVGSVISSERNTLAKLSILLEWVQYKPMPCEPFPFHIESSVVRKGMKNRLSSEL